MDRGRGERLATEMSSAMQASSLPTMDDLRLLAYVQHMAETAQSDAARHMFQEYMELEKRRLKAAGGPGVRAQTEQGTAAMQV